MTSKLATRSVSVLLLNPLNFYAKVTSSLDARSGAPSVEHAFDKKALETSVGGFFTTHMAMITVMNDLLGSFSKDLAVDLVTNGCAG